MRTVSLYSPPAGVLYPYIQHLQAYCMADFTAAKRWNFDTDELTDETESRETPYPVIIMTPDGQYALGSYAHPSDDFYIDIR